MADYQPYRIELTYGMLDIWETVPDSWTISIKQNVQFQVGYTLKNFNLSVLKMEDSTIINFNMPDIWQTLPDS